MNSILIIGVIVTTGFLLGELAKKIRLPRVTGYILAGVLLNPSICTFIPQSFPQQTDSITNIALAFITFSIGGSLYYAHIKKLGRGILLITLFEAELAFLVIALGFSIIAPLIMHGSNYTWATTFLPLSLLLGSLGSPTDPSATLAVKQEYKPSGEVSETMLAVAALDDVTGIINYSVAIVIAAAFATSTHSSVSSTILTPLTIISGSILLGIIFGLIFNFITRLIEKESEGVLIVVVFGLLTICFGLASLLKADSLLAVMTLGAIVVNFNEKREKIFQLMERYIDEIIFVLFFTLSGMHLDFSILLKSLPIVLFFVIFRASGKFLGVFTGATISHSSKKIKKYTAGGLIPQGGIVIGLALLIRQNPAFNSISDTIISVIIGSTIIHELIGPICAKLSLQGAGEIKK